MKKVYNNFRKNWVTYGFETVVVIVGILGAFVLNNWNERRKDNIKEQAYLFRLENDIEEDISYYNRRIFDDSIEMKGLYTIVHEMYKEQKSLEDLESLFDYTTFPTEHLTIQNFTFYELSTTGNLNLISNTTLKELLIGYYRRSEEAGKHIQEYNEWSVLRFMDYYDAVHSSKFMKWGKMRLFDKPEMFEHQDWSFINDPSSEKFQKVEGVMDAYHAKLYTLDNYFRSLKKEAEKILTVLHREIK